jgi:hypothetical protein
VSSSIASGRTAAETRLRGHRAAQEGGRAHETGHELVRRPQVDLLRAALLHDPAVAQDDDAVRDDHGLGLVVGDVHGGDAEPLVDLGDLEAHLLAQQRVEVGQRLVEQQDVGLEHDRTREGHALLLAARELARVAVAEAFQLDHAEHRTHFLGDDGGGKLPHLETEGQVLVDRHVRPERVVLEHEADAAPLGRDVGDAPFADEDVAARRGEEAGNGAQRGGLAAAGGAEQGHQLAVADDQVEPVQGGDLAVADRQVLQTKFGHGAVFSSIPCRPRIPP